MISEKNEELKKGSIIYGSVLALVGIAMIVVAILCGKHAEELKEAGKIGYLYGDSSYAIEYMMMTTLSSAFTVAGIILILGAVAIVALMLGIYCKTKISIDGETVTGIAMVNAFKSKNFSSSLQKITEPALLKNRITFKIDGEKYTVYTDDADTAYRMLCEKK